MWTVIPLLLSLLAAQPAPETYVRVGCWFLPVNFDNQASEMNPGSRAMLVQTARNFIGPGRPAPHVLLRIFTTEPWSSQSEPQLYARADAVRRVLIENGFAPDHIVINRGEGESRWPVPENWHGVVIETEYFLPRGRPDPTVPPHGGMVC